MGKTWRYPNSNRKWKPNNSFTNNNDNSINDKVNKYSNDKVVVDNIKFHSKLEARAYNVLKQMLMAKVIKSFEMQVKYSLQDKFRNQLGKMNREIKYFADFVVIGNNDEEFVIDTKGYSTEIAKIKLKLFEYKFNKILYIIKSMEALNNLILGGVYNGKSL
jgi:hypothetical protein